MGKVVLTAKGHKHTTRAPEFCEFGIFLPTFGKWSIASTAINLILPFLKLKTLLTNDQNQ